MRRLLAGLLCLVSIASADVHYKLTPQPSAKTVTVAVTIDHPKSVETFRIPAWCPGYYQIAQYEKKIFDVKATDPTGRSLSIEAVDSRSWRVYGAGSEQATVSYKILGDDPGLGFFAVFVDNDKTYVNGASAFMYIDGHNSEKVDLAIQNPSNWDIATPMTRVEGGTYTAENYDEFIDHPIQLGVFQRRKFSIGKIPFEVIFVAPDNNPKCDLDAETERLRRVSEPALKLFGGAQFKRYLYILHLAIGSFNGGLEHRACNVQAIANSSELNLDDLAAHEYFHAWNVKQVRPRILGPFDYTRPQRTSNLWFAEGVTDYYSKLHAYQSGLKTDIWMLNDLAEQIRSLQGGQTRKIKSVEDASKGCWEADGFSIGDLSFYTKGLLAGFIFDAAIIQATDGAKTLDDVLRLLYQRGHLPHPGYDEDELRQTINEVAGRDLSDIYSRMIRSTQELPYQVLQGIGLKLSIPDLSQDNPINRTRSDYWIEFDPNANDQAKRYLGIWLHRLNRVE